MLSVTATSNWGDDEVEVCPLLSTEHFLAEIVHFYYASAVYAKNGGNWRLVEVVSISITARHWWSESNPARDVNHSPCLLAMSRTSTVERHRKVIKEPSPCPPTYNRHGHTHTHTDRHTPTWTSKQWHAAAAVVRQLEERISSFWSLCHLTFCMMAAAPVWRKWPWVLWCDRHIMSHTGQIDCETLI